MNQPTQDDIWNLYSCAIEDRPHSTFVNLSIGEQSLIPPLPVFYGIDGVLQTPYPNQGMTTDNEFDRLCDLGDLIGSFNTAGWTYVARQTGNEKRRFFFYANNATAAQPVLAAMAVSFLEYSVSHFSFKDPNWDTFWDNLYPNEIAWNEICNRDVRIQLQKHGDDLDVPHEVDHTVQFTSSKGANNFAKLAQEKGYTVIKTSKGFLSKRINLLLQKVQIPSELDSVTLELKQTSQALGGTYDGWGCVVGS